MISVFSSSRISTSGDVHALNRASPERAACELPADIPDHVADELRQNNGHQRHVCGLTERDSCIDFLTAALIMSSSKIRGQRSSRAVGARRRSWLDKIAAFT